VKSNKLVDFGIPIFGGFMLIMMVGLTFVQIVGREFFDYSFNWSDEVAQFSMTWLALFGSIWCAKNNHHLNTGMRIHEKLGGKLVYLIDAILSLLIIVISLVIAYQCAIFSSQQMVMESMSLPWVKMGYIYIVFPIAMVASGYYYFKAFVEKLVFLFKKEKKS
jgi:TRAP-type C4-dicarboxylate transport system permease small subunit